MFCKDCSIHVFTQRLHHKKDVSPVGYGCRIHRLLRAKTPSDEYPNYDVNPSDGEAPILEIWGMESTPSLPMFPGPLWPRVVPSDRVLSMGQIERTICTNKWLIINCDCYIAIVETIYLYAKKSSGLFQNVIYKMCLQIIYIFDIYVSKGFGIK